MSKAQCNCGESIEGYHTGDCSIFSTTTDHDLLAKYTPLEKCENVMSNHHEIEGQNYLGNPTRECAECGSYFPCVTHSFAKALLTVLKREDKECGIFYYQYEKDNNSGYNQALAEIKADIAKELG